MKKIILLFLILSTETYSQVLFYKTKIATATTSWDSTGFVNRPMRFEVSNEGTTADTLWVAVNNDTINKYPLLQGRVRVFNVQPRFVKVKASSNSIKYILIGE
jgi:hypothetical protein